MSATTTSFRGHSRGRCGSTFESEVFPVLTPLALGPGHPFPHISNLSLNLAVVVRDPQLGERFARMKVPGVLPRLIPCPPVDGSNEATQCFVWLEEVIAANLDALFPGLQVLESHPFRVTRDADIEIKEDDASDLLETVEEGLRQRQFGDVCRLEVCADMPERLRDLLVDNLLLDPADVYGLDGPLGLSDVMALLKLDRPDLKDPPFVPGVPPELSDPDEAMLDVIGRQDLLLHHPYQSFRPVVDFIDTATKDTNVLAIKQTLYRVGSNSPIVKALAEARDDDTQVAVLVELKARFDEEHNIEWARALEDAGVHVVYGLVGLKTHCKLALLVHKERDGRLKPLRPPGHGQLQPGHGAHLHRLFPALRPARPRRGRLRAVQPADGLLAPAPVSEIAGRAGEHARAPAGNDRAGGEPRPPGPPGPADPEDQHPERRADHPRPVRGVAGGRAD